jgi:hypothetical protein
MNANVKDLFERAHAYADFAVQNLTLELTPQPLLPETSDTAMFTNLMQQINLEQPDIYMEIRRRDYLVHFMFPSLDAKERAAVGCLHASSRLCKERTGTRLDADARQAFDAAKDMVTKFESKLTLLQIEALEDDFFNWPANHPYG